MGPCTTILTTTETVNGTTEKLNGAPEKLSNGKAEKLSNGTTSLTSDLKAKKYVNGNKPATDLNFKHRYAWRNIIFMVYAHLGAFYGLYLLLTEARRIILFEVLYGYASVIGVTGGTHRLWSHKCYKANLPLRTILMIMQTMAFQNHIYEWCRDHRVHHKFSETDADPHNAKRGFFFCHVGWLLVKKHPDVKIKGKTVDMSDLERDGVVMFQKMFYPILMPLFAFILPTWIPVYFWGVDPWTAWYATLFRWVLTVNGTWCVNSYAHLWGPKPYDKNIGPTESPFVISMTVGEGFHNYHHAFPYDYKAAELRSPMYNFTATFIDFFASIGWAWDLKVISEETIRKRIQRTGDGTHPVYGTQTKDQYDLPKRDHLWGWGDVDMDDDDYKTVDILLKKDF